MPDPPKRNTPGAGSRRQVMRWALPVSVALTQGISVDFFYLRLLICLNLAGHLSTDEVQCRPTTRALVGAPASGYYPHRLQQHYYYSGKGSPPEDILLPTPPLCCSRCRSSAKAGHHALPRPKPEHPCNGQARGQGIFLSQAIGHALAGKHQPAPFQGRTSSIHQLPLTRASRQASARPLSRADE